MSITVNDNFKVNAPKLIDDRSKKVDGSPYFNKAEVLSSLPLSRRTVGLLVLIGEDYYYFKTGVALESDLHLLTPEVPTDIVETVTGNLVDNTDPSNPIVDLDPSTIDLSQFGNASANPFVRQTALDDKVDKIAGRGLSEANYTNTEKSKLATIETSAQVNKIERIYFNGDELPITSKAVYIDSQDDKITHLGNILTDENEVTFTTGFQWRINGQNYANASDFVTTIPYAGAGLERKDIVVVKDDNTMQRIAGTEVASNPVLPAVPPNTLLLSTISVYEDSIGTPTPPVIGDDFIAKVPLAVNVSVEGGEPIFHNTTILTEDRRFIIVDSYSGTGNILGILVEGGGTLYPDLRVVLRNDSGGDIILEHGYNTDIDIAGFYFQNGQDYRWRDGETIEFSYSGNSNKQLHSFSSSNASILEYNITSDVTAGAIEAGDTVIEGTTLTEFVEQLLLKTFYPTFTAYSISGNAGSAVEVGTGTKSITVNFTRGGIVGDAVGGIWNPTTVQGNVLGTATKYWIDSIDNGTTNSLNISKLTTLGSNSVDIAVDYGAGDQPKDSKGNNYLSPEPSGTLTGVATWTGFYYRTAIAGNSVPTASDIRNNYTARRSNAGVINMATGTSNVRFDLFLPQGSTLTSAIDQGNLGLDITSGFVLQGSDFSGLDANGDEVLYKHYVREIDNPYSVSSNIALTVT